MNYKIPWFAHLDQIPSNYFSAFIPSPVNGHPCEVHGFFMGDMLANFDKDAADSLAYIMFTRSKTTDEQNHSTILPPCVGNRQ